MSSSTRKSAFRIAVLISGGGTTLRNLIKQIDAGRLDVQITLVVSSHREARGLQFAEAAGIRQVVAEPAQFNGQDALSAAIFDHCRQAQVDAVVMAGFLKQITIFFILFFK